MADRLMLLTGLHIRLGVTYVTELQGLSGETIAQDFRVESKLWH